MRKIVDVIIQSGFGQMREWVKSLPNLNLVYFSNQSSPLVNSTPLNLHSLFPGVEPDRAVKEDVGKKLFRNIASKNPDVLILDFIDARIPILSLDSYNSVADATLSKFYDPFLDSLRRDPNVSITKLDDFTIKDLVERAKRYNEKIREKWKGEIIVIETYIPKNLANNPYFDKMNRLMRLVYAAYIDALKPKSVIEWKYSSRDGSAYSPDDPSIKNMIKTLETLL